MTDDGPPGRDAAFRTCQTLRRLTWLSFKWGLIIGVPLSLVGIGMAIVFLSITLMIVLALIRTLIVAVYFARVSILHMFGFAMGTGLLLTIDTFLPDDMRGISMMVWIGVVCFIFYRISEMDPTGDNLQPAFFLEAVEEQEKRREAERQKAKAEQPPKDPTIP